MWRRPWTPIFWVRAMLRLAQKGGCPRFAHKGRHLPPFFYGRYGKVAAPSLLPDNKARKRLLANMLLASRTASKSKNNAERKEERRGGSCNIFRKGCCYLFACCWRPVAAVMTRATAAAGAAIAKPVTPAIMPTAITAKRLPAASSIATTSIARIYSPGRG